MKKSIKEGKTLKESIIFKLGRYQKMYDIVFGRLNIVIEQQIKENGVKAKTFLPKQLKQ